MLEILVGYIVGTLFGILVTFQWAFRRGVLTGAAAILGVDEEELNVEVEDIEEDPEE